jgi:hypothetical protein
MNKNLTIFVTCILLLCSISISNARTKKSKKFELLLPTKFEVIDETIFRKEQKNGKFPFSIHIYNEDDIKLSIKESDFSHKIKCVTLSENNVIIDTLVVSETYFSYRKWENNRAVDYYDSRKIKPQISYSKYRENYLQSNGSYKKCAKNHRTINEKIHKRIKTS